MNTTKIKNILANSLGGLIYGLTPLLGHPDINYAVTDADEFTLVSIGLVSYGISDVVKNKTAKEFFNGAGSGAFGLLGFDISYSLTTQLKTKT